MKPIKFIVEFSPLGTVLATTAAVLATAAYVIFPFVTQGFIVSGVFN